MTRKLSECVDRGWPDAGADFVPILAQHPGGTGLAAGEADAGERIIPRQDLRPGGAEGET